MLPSSPTSAQACCTTFPTIPKKKQKVLSTCATTLCSVCGVCPVCSVCGVCPSQKHCMLPAEPCRVPGHSGSETFKCSWKQPGLTVTSKGPYPGASQGLLSSKPWRLDQKVLWEIIAEPSSLEAEGGAEEGTALNPCLCLG